MMLGQSFRRTAGDLRTIAQCHVTLLEDTGTSVLLDGFTSSICRAVPTQLH